MSPYSVLNIKIRRSKYNLSFFYRSRCVLMTVQKAQEALKVEEKNQFRTFLNRVVTYKVQRGIKEIK